MIRRSSARATADRRTTPAQRRRRSRLFWDFLFRMLRFFARHAVNAYAIFGIFLLSGAAVAIAGTWGFTELAGHVSAGKTQAFDNAVMQWVGAHQYPMLQSLMLEFTALATSSVVTAIVLISGMFLWLNNHKHSATLLGAATLGAMVLNQLLKHGFQRPRPKFFQWGTQVMSSSFPSGHAMSAAVVYFTVAYLAARLQRKAPMRVMTMVVAVVIVVLISVSRVYLGVHYPSDVLAGVTIGLAWAAFCMAILEAAQLYAKRNAPQMLEDEAPAPAPEPSS
jgi:undecaprenyl-diphosphatase